MDKQVEEAVHKVIDCADAVESDLASASGMLSYYNRVALRDAVENLKELIGYANK